MVVGQPYTYVPADRNQAAGGRAGEPKILPTAHLREYDPVTIFFDRDAVPGNVGPIEPSRQLVSITPSHPGEFIKIDDRTLEFRPTVPWEPLRRYRVASGRTSRELITLLPLPNAVHPASGSVDLDTVGRIGLEFSYKVNPQALSRLASFEVCALPGVDSRSCRTLRASEYSVREAVRSASEYVYWFTFNEPIGYGQRIRMNLKLAERADFRDAVRVYSFETRPVFAVESAGTLGQMLTLSAGGINYDARRAVRLGQERALVLEFSAPPADPGLSAVKNLVNIAPAPAKFGYRIEDKRIIIDLGIDQERLYKVTLNPVAIRDRAGRPLTNRRSNSFFVFLPTVTPSAQWERGFGIVERFGPQRFPIKTTGVSSLDFRVYRIDPLHSAFSRFPRSPVVVSESARPPGPGEEPGRLDSIPSWLQSAEMVGRHIMMLGSPHFSGVVDIGEGGIDRAQNINLKPMFESVAGKDRPGTYLVGFRLLDGSPERHYVRVDVTDLALSTVESRHRVLFGVTSYTTGRAVPNARISIDGIVDGRMTTLAHGRTGDDGTFTLEHTSEVRARFSGADVRRVVVSSDDDVLVLDVRGPGSARVFADNHWYSQRYGGDEWLRWLGFERRSTERDKNIRGFVRTERPIYRPEDSIFIKGYVRETIHGKINMPQRGLSFQLRVRSPGNTHVDHPVTLNEFGSFDLKLPPQETATGRYRVELMNNVGQRVSMVASTDFVVEAYRIPRFELRLGGADRIPNDRPAEVRAAASYYAGGRVVDQDIRWRVTSFPYDHTPRGFADYILSSDGRYGAVTAARRESVFEESGKTDENGSARVTLNPQAATAGNPTRYVVEATVTDADRQTVSARHSVIALPPFILGVNATRHITSGSTIAARVIAIGVNDSLIAGQRVNVSLKRVTWTSYLADSDFSQGRPRYITDESVDLIEERTILTGTSPVALEFRDQQPGVYILELSSRDRLGRLQSVKIDLFLAGSGPHVWKRAERNVFETVPCRDSYEAGQNAQILIKSPYSQGLALAVVELPTGDIQHRWVEINNGQGTFTLGIQPEMTPRIPVSFLLMRPRVASPNRTDNGEAADMGRPETMGNTTWLTVKPTANTLNVGLTHAPVVTPDGMLDITVSIRDNRGRPQAGEVALWLVDEAVLSLRAEKSLNPLEAFIEEVSSRITMRDSRNIAIGYRHAVNNPGGDGGDYDDVDGLGRITPRKNFKVVPYWNPSIRVDRSGNVTVRVHMPSDLTNFAVRAMAVSGSDKFGSARSRVSVRIPVTVQPALPRFVRLGDRIRAGGVARVVEGAGGAATWSIEARGLTVRNVPNRQIQLDNVRPLPLLADLHVETPPFTQRGTLQWDSVTVKMALQRASDRAGDAFEVSIPVLTDRQFIEEARFAQFGRQEGFTWDALPSQARANTVNTNLLISDNQYLPTIFSAMTALVRYPYGCTEQLVSQSFPSLVYKTVWDKYGIESPDPSISASIGRTMEFLKTTQHGDGLFGYWPGTTGYVYLTAYVVDFLTEVRTANRTLRPQLAFDQRMYTSAIDALKRALRSDYARFVGGHAAHERTAALAALARSGHIDIGYARELAAAARELDVHGMSNVFSAVTKNQNALGTEFAMLEERLWASTIFVDRQGRQVFSGFQRHASPLGSRMHANDATALASFVNAVSPQTQSGNAARVPLMVDELVRMGSGADAWGSIHANSMALRALRTFVSDAPSSQSSAFRLSDGDRTHQLTMSGALSRHWQNGKAGNITYTGQDNRTFWAKMSRRHMPEALGSHAEPQQRGFAVRRGLIRVNRNAAPERFAIDRGGNTLTFNPGDIIEEHVQVINPETRLFVAVSIPIAAGVEPLNPRLENASSDARPTNRTTNEGSYTAFFDDRVVYFFERMEAGTYDFYFRTQAITEGEFTHPPARAEMMYQMSVYGESAGSRIVVGQ
jgi:hypothetical protein